MTEAAAPPPSKDPALVASLCTLHGDTLRAGFAQGRLRFGALAIEYAAFAEHAVRGTLARLERRLGAPDDTTIREAVEGACLADLYLAAACEHGDERAWTLLSDTFLPRLTGLLAKRGGRGADPAQLASGLLARLALPPPKQNARTLLGTYGAAGSLWGWLAATAVNDLRRDLQRRQSDPSAERAARVPVRAAPWAGALADETAAELESALDEGWAACSTDERLVLQWSHHDGLSGRRIAHLLDVPEYKVSRLRGKALQTLRTAVERHVTTLPEHGADAAPVWERLRTILANHLATHAASTDPPSGDDSSPESSHG